MITRYNNFKEELILESIINESIVHYSPPLRDLISKVGGDIGDALLDVEKTDVKPDVTFIDLDKEGYFSFITMKNAINLLKKEWPDTPEDKLNNSNDWNLEQLWNLHKDGNFKNDIYSKSRNSLKIGKLINKIFPGKFTDKEIEEFVNKIKAGSSNEGEKFEIVEGVDIAYWYDYKNYLEVKGQLGNSCMKEKPHQVFNIYTKNPEVCRMLILKEGDKIKGRALIWKLLSIKKLGKDIEGVEYFLDRQYTIEESDVIKFRNYAKEKKWAYKAHNNHHSLSPIIFNDEEFNAGMKVQLKEVSDDDYEYNRYPYMDTFRRYNPKTGILYNDDDDDSSNEGQYLLHNTDGSYHEIESGVWSEWYGRMIPEEYAVWSDWADSYLDRDRVVYVEDGTRRYHGVYPDDCDDIVYDEWNDIHININDAVYSEAYGYSILAEDAVQVITSIDLDGDPDYYDDNWYHRRDDDIIDLDDCNDMVWFEILSDKFTNWRYAEYIIDDVMTKNYYNEWIPNMYAIKTYKVLEPKNIGIDITGIDYLTEVDADILGYDIDKDKERTNDQFQYHRDIEPILGKLYKTASNEWIKITNQLEGKGQLRIKFKDFNEDDYLKALQEKADKYNQRLQEIEGDEFIETDFTITRHHAVN